MQFNDHSRLNLGHAFLSPSQSSWLNYDDEKIEQRYVTARAAQRGTELHAFAQEAIRLGIKMANTKSELNMFVNDAIGFRMESEQTLFYSENCYGTADAIAFNEKRHLLRVHDLKTGVHPANMTQLLVYAALFCLEYGYKPFELNYELRIYQNGEVFKDEPTGEDVAHIMSKIVHADKQLRIVKNKLT